MSEYWEYVSTSLFSGVPSSLSELSSSEQLSTLTGGLIVDGLDLLLVILGFLTSFLALLFLVPLATKACKNFRFPSCNCFRSLSLGRLFCGQNGSASSAKPQPKLVRLSTTFTVPNFLAADLLLEKESYLESPVFSAVGYPKERFQLRVHPRAGKNGDEVSLFLRYVPVVETMAPVATNSTPEVASDANSSATPNSSAANPTPAAPVPKVATVHFVCRIVTPKGTS